MKHAQACSLQVMNYGKPGKFIHQVKQNKNFLMKIMTKSFLDNSDEVYQRRNQLPERKKLTWFNLPGLGGWVIKNGKI